MPGSKVFSIAAATGATVYAIVKRLSDGAYLNDATGVFAIAPADPYLALTEDGTMKGLYAASEARAAWAAGLYRVTYYRQVGGSPSPTADAPPLAAQDVAILGDQVFDPYQVAAAAAGSRAFILRALRAMKDNDTTVAGLAEQLQQTNSQASTLDKNQRRSERAS